MKNKDEILVCQKNFSHVWGEMPFIQKCCECSGELIPYLPSSSVKELVEALKDCVNAMKGCRCRGGYETFNDQGDFITIGDAQAAAEAALKQFEEKND